MKTDNISTKAVKKKKIMLVSLIVVLVCGTLLGTLLAYYNQLADKFTNESHKEAVKATASDKETLRELLLKDEEYIIILDETMEVNESFTVNGKKTLTGNGTLRMALDSEWGQSMLNLSKKAALTVDGPSLDCNYVADGINMGKNATLTYKSGTITASCSYGIHARGKVDIENINLEKAEYIAVFADDGSKVNITGGNFTENSTNNIYVEKNATVNIEKKPEFTGCMGNSVENYGTLNVKGGIFSDTVLYTFNNFGKINVTGDENNYIECSKSRLGVFCTRGGAETIISGVHVDDTTAQAVVTVGGNTEISNCKFENTGGHAIEIQKGTAAVENVSVAASKKDGIEVYTNGDIKVKNISISKCDGIGIAVRGGKLAGSDINITGGGKYGISCGNSANGNASVSVSNVNVLNTEKSGFYVYNNAVMDLKDVVAAGTNSRGIYIEDTASLTLSGDSKIYNNNYRGIEARGKFVMNDGKVFDNKVENSGAGVYVSENGNFTMNGGCIYNNASGLRGGGICVTEGTVTINKGDIYNNTSKDNGGGLYAQKTAVVTLKNGKIANNRSEIYGDGIYVASAATKVELSENFYVGGNDIKLGNVESVLQISGNRLARHSASDPLLLTPSYSAKEETVLATCKNESIAKSIAVKVKSGDGSYEVKRTASNFVVSYAAADMDMSGADTKYVSSFAELKNAVLTTESKRNIILTSDIKMEERLRFPGGVTIAIRDDGNKRTLTRKDGFSDNMIVTHYGTGLYLEATKAGNLIVDGTFVSNGDGKNAQPLVRTAGSTVIRNVVLQNNGALTEGTTVRGAFLRQLYGDFKIYNSTFKGGKCESGGALMLDKGKGLIENSTFEANATLIGGGALRAAAGTKLEILSSEFIGNHAGTAGGAIAAVGEANVTVTDTVFENNTAENFGGALLAQDEGTILTLKGTDAQKAVIKGNSSKTIGAVCVQTKAKLDVSGYIFEGNTATDGRAGAIASNNKGVAVLKNVGFYGNTASGSGGAVSVDNAELTATSCEFGKDGAGNTSGDKGGAILVTGNGVAAVNGENHSAMSNMAYNKATIGGAVCVYGGKATVTGYSFTGNEANDGGGAIYTEPSKEIESCAITEACRFINNTTPSNGGAVHSKGTYTDKNSEYIENNAKNGGAVIAIGGGSITMSGSGAEFSNNSAAVSGNAIFIQGDGSSGNIYGYSFEENAENTIQANGALIFNDLPYAEIVQGKNAVLRVAGCTNADKITITPYEYASNKLILQKADRVSDEIFKDACSSIKVTESDGIEWIIDENGSLSGALNVARIGNLHYATLKEAVAAANRMSDAVIYLEENTAISETLSIKSNVKICNEPGKNVTILRNSDILMFNVVNTTYSLTLGSDDMSGSLTIDASTSDVAGKRIIDNSGTFILGRNAAIKNANSSVWGNVLINRTGEAHLYGSITDNTCSGACGPILQNTDGGKVIFHEGDYSNNSATRTGKNPSLAGIFYVNAGSVEILGGTFNGNTSTGYGSVGYVKSEAELTVSGGTFGEDQSIYVDGTANIGGSIDGIKLIGGQTGIIKVSEGTNVQKITVTAYKYVLGGVVLTKADGMSDEEFKNICKSVTLTQPGGVDWSIDENGKLKADSVAYIGEAYYSTLEEAVNAANKSGGVIILTKNITLTSTLGITGDVKICNESGMDIVISRSSNLQMFTVYEGAKLTFGTNDNGAQGSITVNGDIGTVATTRLINNKGTFILGKNAILTGANNNQWGCVLVNSGTTELYGCIESNICTGAGGAVLQNGGTITIFEGLYQNNMATREQKGSTTASLGGFMRVEIGTVNIKGGTFTDNKTTGDGNALWVKKGTTVKITGGEFGAEQTVYVNGTVNFDNAAGVILVQGENGIINVTGETNADKVSIIPVTYTEGTVVLKKYSGVSDKVFKTVCASVKVVPTGDNKQWIIDENGKLALMQYGKLALMQ